MHCDMDKEFGILIDDTLSGKTVKELLHRNGVSSTLIKELKETEDGIKLSGKKVFVTERVKAGDVLNITIRDKKSDIEPEDIPLDILYEDEDIIAVNKPRNMPIHPSQNHHGDTLANALMHYFLGEDFTFRVITRLDKDTSGVVLLAKNPLSGAILGEEMKSGSIKKEYLALVNGRMNPEEGEINEPIGRREESVILRCVTPLGKEAVTLYETLQTNGKYSLVKLLPLTGRTHQIRVHLSYMGNPIYGDDLYGAAQKNERVRLHCSKISFCHPITGEEMTIEAPLMEDMNLFSEDIL